MKLPYRIILLSFSIFIWSVNSICFAQEEPLKTASIDLSSHSVSLYELIRKVKENNPEIKALKEKYLAARQKITTVQTWEYPQLGFESRGDEKMYSVSQMLPFPGKLSLKGKVTKNESKITEQELNSKIREVVAATKKFYWNYWLINRIIEIYQENIDLMKRFFDIARTQYTSGKVSQTDVLKANTELAEMENMLVILEQEKISVQTELNALLNLKPETPLGPPVQPEIKEIQWTFEELENIALKDRPELKAKEFLASRNAAAVSLARREWYPDIMSGIKFDNMSNDKTAMVQISIPLYYKKQSSIVETMKKEKEMADWELQTTKISTLKELKDLWVKYQSRKKSVQIYETNIIPLAEQTLKIAEIGYLASKNDFLDLLDSQKRYLEYKISYYKYLTEKEIFLSELERVIGINLYDEKH